MDSRGACTDTIPDMRARSELASPPSERWFGNEGKRSMEWEVWGRAQQLTASLWKPVSQKRNSQRTRGRNQNTSSRVMKCCTWRRWLFKKVVSDFRCPRTVCLFYSRSIWQIFKLSWTSQSAKPQSIEGNSKHLLKVAIKSLFNVV